ncbi:MAG: exodeoxyribonuclease VII small subunit [Moorellales bacterium]
MAETITFEEALRRLEAIVKRLESGDLSLEEALAGFEEGVSLVRFCRQRLTAAEQRLQLLLEQADGTAVCQTWEEDPGAGRSEP